MAWKRLLRWIPLLAVLAGTGAFADPSALPVTVRPPIPDAFDDPVVPMPDPDLWQRIRKGFLLEPLDSPLVVENEAWYSSRPDYIKRFVDRGSRYLHHIVEEVEKRNMPTEIALLPVVESAFNPLAYSRSKASGLWQFIPSTGKNYGLRQDWYKDNRRDIVAATHAALNYLQRLYDMFGSWELALAAYNCGEGCVGRAIAANQRRGLPTDFLSLKLPPETMNYVPKLIAVKNIVLSPATYGIDLESIPDQPYFTTVEAPRQDRREARGQAGRHARGRVRRAQPGAQQAGGGGAYGHAGPAAGQGGASSATNLENWDQPLVTWNTIQGKKGESVNAIAKRYGFSGASLKQVNNLQVNKKGRLTASQPILVPGRGKGKRAGRGCARRPRSCRDTASAPAPARAAPQAHATSHYTVKAGDTLYGIARQFGKAVPDLLQLNNLSARAIITPGLRLRVY